jgi:hypothetical protein
MRREKFPGIDAYSKDSAFTESETKFFLKIIDAQITFVKDDKGEVTEMLLHQSGKDHPAKRIE